MKSRFTIPLRTTWKYLQAGEMQQEKDSPLFRTTVGRSRRLTDRGLQRQESWAMIKRRALEAGINPDV